MAVMVTAGCSRLSIDIRWGLVREAAPPFTPVSASGAAALPPGGGVRLNDPFTAPPARRPGHHLPFLLPCAADRKRATRRQILAGAIVGLPVSLVKPIP